MASMPQSRPLPGRPTTPGNMRHVPAPRNISAGSTPPVSRTPSGDWTQQVQRTPPGGSRPNSRNAGTLLNPQSQGGLLADSASRSSPNLSAREQMHVARATGTPLINVRKDSRNETPQNPGLIGALEAREREKAASRYGMRSGAVQQAIASRQQQQAQAEMQAHMQAQYQMQQAAQASQAAYAAQYQAQFAQQAFGNAANVQQQVPSHYAPSMYGFGQQSVGTPGQRSSVYMDPYQQQNNTFQAQGVPQQQSNRASYYGDASNYGGYMQQPR